MNNITEQPDNIEFPKTFYFYNNKDEKLQKMTVTEEAWNNTANIINDNTERNAKIKMLSKQPGAEVQQNINLED